MRIQFFSAKNLALSPAIKDYFLKSKPLAAVICGPLEFFKKQENLNFLAQYPNTKWVGIISKTTINNRGPISRDTQFLFLDSPALHYQSLPVDELEKLLITHDNENRLTWLFYNQPTAELSETLLRSATLLKNKSAVWGASTATETPAPFLLDSGKSTGLSDVIALSLPANEVDSIIRWAHGWSPFGPWRQITKSSGRVVYEIDNTSAQLTLRKYFGYATGGFLASAINLPFALYQEKDATEFTLLAPQGVEGDTGIIYNGHLPQGSWIRFAQSTSRRMIETSHQNQAANRTQVSEGTIEIMISCQTRKELLGFDHHEDFYKNQIKKVDCFGYYSSSMINLNNPFPFVDMSNLFIRWAANEK